jgi:hypothetical protein
MSYGETQITRMAEALSSGRWVGIETFIEMHVPDYRRRLGEMQERGARLESRYRDRVRADGTKYRAKDWRDLDAYEAAVASVADQARMLRRSFAEKPPRSGTETVRFNAHGTTIAVTVGRLMYLTPEAFAEEVAAAWCDPFKGGAS